MNEQQIFTYGAKKKRIRKEVAFVSLYPFIERRRLSGR